MHKHKAPTMSAVTNSTAVEGSGTQLTENVTGCGCCGLEIWIVALVVLRKYAYAHAEANEYS